MFTVLILDDEPDICALMRRVFERFGWRAVCSSDPALVPDTLARAAVDVVLMDVMMPGVDGLEVLRQIRASGGAGVATVPVVMYSALSDPAVMARAMAGGADDYLTKPTPVAEIVERVGRAAREGLRRGRGGRAAAA
jgi:DNA-binding response OmpR family regulator